MTHENQETIQTLIIDSFKDCDDATFTLIIETFVYGIPHTKIATKLESFLKDNGVMEAYLRYYQDMNGNHLFKRASMSDRDMIETMKHAFLNAAFNRFRSGAKIQVEFKKMEARVKKLNTLFKSLDASIKKVMDGGSNDVYHEGLDELRDYYIAKK